MNFVIAINSNFIVKLYSLLSIAIKIIVFIECFATRSWHFVINHRCKNICDNFFIFRFSDLIATNNTILNPKEVINTNAIWKIARCNADLLHIIEENSIT